MKYTLLETVQRVLSSIKGEEVNSYSDTAESLAVKDIIKECYYTILSTQDFPELKTLFELNASGDNDKPVLMSLPSDVVGLEWVKYNKIQDGETAPVYEYVYYLPLVKFLEITDRLSTDDTTVGSFTHTTGASDSIEFYYRNDGAPQWYTTIDDNYVIFDSYDSTIDTTLQKTKTKCYGLKNDTWEDSDTFEFALDAQQFTILLKEAKAMAWLELKQTQNVAAETQARKAHIKAEVKKDRVNYNHKDYYYNNYPNYGRK